MITHVAGLSAMCDSGSESGSSGGGDGDGGGGGVFGRDGPLTGLLTPEECGDVRYPNTLVIRVILLSCTRGLGFRTGPELAGTCSHGDRFVGDLPRRLSVSDSSFMGERVLSPNGGGEGAGGSCTCSNGLSGDSDGEST